jgi:hypothetical protein
MKLSALALLLAIGSQHMIIPLALAGLFAIGVSGRMFNSAEFEAVEYFITITCLTLVHIFNLYTVEMLSQEVDYCFIVIKAAFLVWLLHPRFEGARRAA